MGTPLCGGAVSPAVDIAAVESSWDMPYWKTVAAASDDGGRGSCGCDRGADDWDSGGACDPVKRAWRPATALLRLRIARVSSSGLMIVTEEEPSDPCGSETMGSDGEEIMASEACGADGCGADA
jgi:hypothetical protein